MATGGLTRRGVFRLASGAAGLAVAGRWRGSGAQSTTPAADRPVLRVGVAGLVEGLDPQTSGFNQQLAILTSLFDSPLARDFRNGDPPGTGAGFGPMLATEWQAEDETTLLLRLRDGVLFHDGTPMTAEDVKFTFERVRDDPTGEFERARSQLGESLEVEVVDPLTLLLRTADPDPLREKRLTIGAAMIVPKAYTERTGVEAFARQPIGSGPYRFVEYRPDDALILESHDSYWGGLPPASRVEFRVLPEVAARIAALVAGEVDIIAELPPDQVAALEGSGGVEVRNVPHAGAAILYYNGNHPTIRDKRLRQALNLAIDRQLLIDALWQGRAAVPHSYQFPAWGALYDESRPIPPYDPVRAKELIVEAGYDGEEIPFRISMNYYTMGEQVAQAVVEMWRAVGLNATVAPFQQADFWSDPERSLVTMAVNNDEFGDPVSFWLRLYAESNPGQHWWTDEANKRFTELGLQLQRTLDEQARRAATQEMLDIYAEEAPGTVLYVPTQNYGVRQGIDWVPYSFFFMDFRGGNLRFP
jgi:peptide/nickel transport system substrate-binding protein